RGGGGHSPVGGGANPSPRVDLPPPGAVTETGLQSASFPARSNSRSPGAAAAAGSEEICGVRRRWHVRCSPSLEKGGPATNATDPLELPDIRRADPCGDPGVDRSAGSRRGGGEPIRHGRGGRPLDVDAALE